MKTTTLVLLSIIIIFEYLLYSFVSGCVFKERKRWKSGYWDLQDHPRKLYTGGGGCNCGIFYKNTTANSSPQQKKSFLLYVFSYNWLEDRNHSTLCPGTIIASNLVTVSHICLEFIDHQIQVYDTWRPLPNHRSRDNAVNPNMVSISTTPDITKGALYKVKDIIFNTRYALSAIPKENETLLDDMALLVTTDNLFEKGHNSICIPKSAKANEKDSEDTALGQTDVVEQLGLYYDFTVESSSGPIIEVQSDLQKFVIMSGMDCDKEGGFSNTSARDTLCVRSLGNSVPVKSSGAPLILTSAAGDKSNFLVGLSTKISVKSKSKKSVYRYSYFSNIISLVKYIEMIAHKMGSEWCKSKDFKLGRKNKPPPAKDYPWKTVGKPIKRDESLDCACGIRNDPKNAKIDGRISGGVEAEPYEFPWLVFLNITFGDREAYCGGAVINDRLILTATHCVVAPEDDIALEGQVKISTHNRLNDPNTNILKLSNFYYHPRWIETGGFGNSDGDIAVISLQEPIQFSTLRKPGGSSELRPICVPSRGHLIPLKGGEIATVAGWGLTNPNNESSLSDVLLKLDVPILPYERCQKISNGVIQDKMLCAGSIDDKKDHQKGDSGGPLMLSQLNGQIYQVGIVSFGAYLTLNGENKVMGVYTDNQRYVDFIDYYSQLEGAKWCKSA